MNTEKEALQDALTQAVLNALTPAVAAEFRDAAAHFVRPRVVDTLRGLAAVDPEIGTRLPTRNTAAQVQAIIEPAVAELVRRSPAREYVQDAASELLAVTHAVILNEIRDAVVQVPRKRAPKG